MKFTFYIITFLMFFSNNNQLLKSKPLKVGDILPNFSLTDTTGESFDSEDYIGKQPLVIFFYPKNNAPVCTSEVCSFRDSFKEFEELNAKIVGISTDHALSHQAFSKKHNLPYTLLTDYKKRALKLFGVSKNIFGQTSRVTYITNKEGIIIYIFKNHTDAHLHTEEALKALKNDI